MLTCSFRSWRCRSTWAVALEERGSEPTWLCCLCCCLSSQKFQYDYIAKTTKNQFYIISCKLVLLLVLLTDVLRFHHQTDLYSGALFVQVCLGWNLYLSTVLMLVVTALYTIAGAQTSTKTYYIVSSGLISVLFYKYWSGNVRLKIPIFSFRWSCCCNLHRHSADVCHDCWGDHPNDHWSVLFY